MQINTTNYSMFHHRRFCMTVSDNHDRNADERLHNAARIIKTCYQERNDWEEGDPSYSSVKTRLNRSLWKQLYYMLDSSVSAPPGLLNGNIIRKRVFFFFLMSSWPALPTLEFMKAPIPCSRTTAKTNTALYRGEEVIIPWMEKKKDWIEDLHVVGTNSFFLDIKLWKRPLLDLSLIDTCNFWFYKVLMTFLQNPRQEYYLI